MKFVAAIFDLDGVLADTEYFQWKGWIEALKPHGITISKEKYFDYAGKTGNIIEAELRRDFKLEVPEGSLLEKKESLLIEWFNTKPLKLMPFARESVQHFIDKNFKVGLVSGGPRAEIMLKLKRLGLLPLFEQIVSRNDVEKGKPHPDMYLLGAEKLGVKPCDCVVFEDTSYGVEAAKGAGMTCVAIPNEFSQIQDFSKADVIVKNLKEAIKWVEERRK